MNEYFPALMCSKLFFGINEETLGRLMACLDPRCLSYGKGGVVVRMGSEVREIGVVVSGRARAVREDALGKAHIVSLLEPGDFIGLFLASGRARKSPVSVRADQETTVIFFSAEKIVSRCRHACPGHEYLLMNLLWGLSEKALELHMRNACLTGGSVREKVLTYLSGVALEKDTATFTVPMDRSAMADYLNVERSSLSRELSRMKKEGLIDYYKSGFKILQKL